MTYDTHRPVIGVFDSGLGGLSVVKALSENLSGLSIVYFGDTARFPYGTKSSETIIRYAYENTAFLLEQGAQQIVVACNTATAAALEVLKKRFDIPIFGVIEPAVQQAVSLTKNGKIGVIGTTRTVKTESYTRSILKLLPNAEVTAVACPLLVSIVEDDCPSDEAKRLLVRAYVEPLKRANIDTLLLGCTHYPLLQPIIQEEMGDTVTIVDPAHSCADCVLKAIPTTHYGASTTYRFFASDDIHRFKEVGETFLGVSIPEVYLTRGLFNDPI